MDEPALVTDLERRTVARLREIPEAHVHLFCASAAERFLEGFETWSVTAEKVPVPEPSAMRRALELCWGGQSEAAEVRELLRWLQEGWLGENHPNLTGWLSMYVAAIYLVEVALSSLLEPRTLHALRASHDALHFHSEVAYLRLDLVEKATGVWPGLDGWEYESDPGVVAEAEHQVLDAEELRTGVIDVRQTRARSAAHGRRVLAEILKLLGPAI